MPSDLSSLVRVALPPASSDIAAPLTNRGQGRLILFAIQQLEHHQHGNASGGVLLYDGPGTCRVPQGPRDAVEGFDRTMTTHFVRRKPHVLINRSIASWVGKSTNLPTHDSGVWRSALLTWDMRFLSHEMTRIQVLGRLRVVGSTSPSGFYLTDRSLGVGV
jgi:hypothetical protein